MYIPAGCLKVYPYTYFESICDAAESILGSCGNVEMQKREEKNGSRIEKRICESCVAWSALMRDKDGRMTRRSIRKEESLPSDSGAEGAAVPTPPDSAVSSGSETDV
ncbi:hypothetical protein SLS63_001557 [Diaporthe eres]|uniref:Uncharacterized protein n=1 Tax=Diaporthe eres TaxID=83184 RepID=A0ABR1PMS6_DIAER